MNNLDFSLQDTYEYIHNILATQLPDFEEINDGTFSEHHKEIYGAYHYYNEERKHKCSLVLLFDKIEFVACNDGEDNYLTLSTENE